MLTRPIDSACRFFKALFQWNVGTRISSGDGVAGPFSVKDGPRKPDTAGRLRDMVLNLECSNFELEQALVEERRAGDSLKVENVELRQRVRHLEFLLEREPFRLEGPEG